MMINRSNFTMTLIITFSFYCFTSKPLSSQTANSSQVIQNQFIEIFADREVINKGENINLKVWVNPEQVKSGNITVFYADRYLKPVEPTSQQKGRVQQGINLPQNSLVDFTFTGINTGKYNLNVEVAGTDPKNQKIPPTRLQIKGLEVKESEFGLWKLLPSSLVGVVLGVGLTSLATFLNDDREQRKEKAKRQQLIVSNLLAHLEANRLSIKNREKTRSEDWMNLFLTGGYYTEIQNLKDKDLAQRLLKVGFDLHEYEQERSDPNSFSEPKKQELENTLPNLIDALNSIAGKLK